MEISMVNKTTLGVDEKSPASKNKSKGELTQYIDVSQQEAMIAKAA